MRKTLSIILAGILVTVFCSLALAEEKKESAMDKGMMQGRMMGQQGMMGEKAMMMDKGKMMGMGNMRGMIMNSMMGKSLVATSDGGAIVLIGNKLQKYDKDLTLQKEAEIKLDIEGMQKMMTQMMEKCSTYEKMMEGGKMEERPKGEETSPAASGHSAQH